MDIRKRGKTWWYDFSINGQRFRGSCNTDNEARARKVLHHEHAKAWEATRLGVKPRRTWEEAVKRYLLEREDLKTYRNYAYLAKWWDEQFEAKKVKYLDQITPEVVARIRDEDAARPKERGGGKRGVADLNRKIGLVRGVINTAYRVWRWMDGTAPLFKLVPGEIQRIRHITPSEAQVLFNNLPEPYGLMARLAVATGLRRGNVLRLKWEHVNLGMRMITIPGKLMKNGAPLSIPISNMAAEILRGQVGKDDVWVFADQNGFPYRPLHSDHWSKAVEKSGLEDFRWHDLRHTWASMMRMQGVDDRSIQELGGWRDIRMVSRYSHLSVEHLQDAASKLDKAFGTQGSHRLTAVPTGT